MSEEKQVNNKVKGTVLPPRTKFYGYDYRKNVELRMTGKEWHAYAKRDTFKTERGSDAAWGNWCEIWLDGKNMQANYKPEPGQELIDPDAILSAAFK